MSIFDCFEAIFKIFIQMTCNIFEEELKHPATREGFVVDDIVEMIEVAYSEQRMTDEYKMQLSKICEAEDKFIKDFDKAKWKEYFDLELVKGELWLIELDSVIRFVFELVKNLYK